LFYSWGNAPLSITLKTHNININNSIKTKTKRQIKSQSYPLLGYPRLGYATWLHLFIRRFLEIIDPLIMGYLDVDLITTPTLAGLQVFRP
jgi:hypothetical protein